MLCISRRKHRAVPPVQECIPGPIDRGLTCRKRRHSHEECLSRCSSQALAPAPGLQRGRQGASAQRSQTVVQAPSRERKQHSEAEDGRSAFDYWNLGLSNELQLHSRLAILAPFVPADSRSTDAADSRIVDALFCSSALIYTSACLLKSRGTLTKPRRTSRPKLPHRRQTTSATSLSYQSWAMCWNGQAAPDTTSTRSDAFSPLRGPASCILVALCCLSWTRLSVCSA